jgi:hypothetical protein
MYEFNYETEPVMEPVTEAPPPTIVKKTRKPRTKKVVIVAEDEPTPVTPDSPYSLPSPPQNEDGLFDDLNNNNFEYEETKEENTKENIELIAGLEKQRKRASKIPKSSVAEDDENLFSEKGTEIIGKDKRMLINKIRQYKLLFPEELKTFKVKKNATPKELQEYLDEFDCIVSTTNVDGFLMDGIVQSLKVIEGVSAMTQNYNVSGLAELLKLNPQFHKLCKQLFIKYGSYTQVDPETQMLFLVLTTAWICKNKNTNKSQLEAYLNEHIPA